MTDSSSSKINEFDQYRFARNESGGLAELPSGTKGERIFLVVDCRRYRLARLHIFEDGTAREEAEWFEKEMEAIRRLKHQSINRIYRWGRDDTEFFYADGLVDGETVGDYLSRIGALPPVWAARIALELISVLRSDRALPRTIENFTFGDLYLEPLETEGMRLVYADFSHWDMPGLMRESHLVQLAGLAFYSLLAGRIVETPADQAFSRDFGEDVPPSFRELCDVAFSTDPSERRAQRLSVFEIELKSALRELERELGDEAKHFPKELQPKRWLRRWLLHDSEKAELSGEYSLTKEPSGRAGDYAVDAEPDRALSYSGLRFQIFPNEETVPREGWLQQHRAALMRPGRRGLPNQLTIQTTLKRGRSMMIGEERAEGLSLYDLVREIGPLSLADIYELGSKLGAALDAIDKSAGTAPVWWLPPENVYIVSGSEDVSSLREALSRYGPNAWQRMPVRLRLHLTSPTLLRGIDLPESLLKKIMLPLPGRRMDAARRTTIMLPLVWYSLTGHRMDWTGRSETLRDLPTEVRDEIEATRRLIIDHPEDETASLLDRLQSIATTLGIQESAVQNLPQDPDAAAAEAFMMAGYTGPVNLKDLRAQKESVGSAVEAASKEASTRFLESESEGVSEPEPLLGVEEEVAAETEPIAFDEEIEALEAPEETNIEGETSEPEVKDFGALLRRFDKPSEEKSANDDEQEISTRTTGAVPIGTISDAGFVSIEEQEVSEETPPSADPEDAEDGGEVISLGVIADEELDHQEGSEPEIELEPDPIEDSSLAEADFGEPEVNFPQKDDPIEEWVAPPLHEKDEAAGFAERLNIPSGEPVPEPAAKKPRMPLWKVGTIALLAALVLAAISFVADHFANFSKGASWQAFSEQLPDTVYVAASSRLPFETATDDDTSAPSPIEPPENLAAALEAGRTSRDSGDYLSALQYFMAGLDLTPDSSEADMEVSETIRNWVASGSFEIGKASVSILEKAKAYEPNADTILADYYLKRDPTEGLRRLQKSAESGYTPHLVRLGLIYSRGKLFPLNMKKAVEYFRRAAEKGDPDGLFYYGECLVLGKGMVQSVQNGMDYLREAADLGDARALNLLGVCQVKGVEWGVNPNAAAGAEHFEQAIDLGDDRAYTNLALCYAKGNGREKLPEEALEILEQGANAGDPEAMLYYAKSIRKGFGGTKNPTLAREWYLKSARFGNKEAIAWCDSQGLEP